MNIKRSRASFGFALIMTIFFSPYAGASAYEDSVQCVAFLELMGQQTPDDDPYRAQVKSLEQAWHNHSRDISHYPLSRVNADVVAQSHAISDYIVSVQGNPNKVQRFMEPIAQRCESGPVRHVPPSICLSVAEAVLTNSQREAKLFEATMQTAKGQRKIKAYNGLRLAGQKRETSQRIMSYYQGYPEGTYTEKTAASRMGQSERDEALALCAAQIQ